MVWLGTLAPAAVAFTSCGTDDEPPPLIDSDGDENDPSEFGVRELQALLDRRAEAQLQGDEEGFLADLDPSNDELIERERLEFENLQQFDVEDIRYTTGQVGSVGEVEPPPPPGQEQESSAPYTFMPVTKAVKLATDGGPDGVLGPGESYEYAVDRRDGSWVVTDIVRFDRAELASLVDDDQFQGLDLSRLNVLPANAPWHLNRLQVINVGNVWLVADDTVSDLDSYADAAAAEVSLVEEIWGDRPRFPGHVLFFTRDKETFARWYDVGHDVEISDLRAGYAVPQAGVRGNGEGYAGEFVGARNLIYLPAAESLWRNPTSVMRHELVHTTTMGAYGTGDSYFLINPPNWAIEGFATFVQVRGDADLEQQFRSLAVQGFAGTLPDSDTFQDGDEHTVSTNYALSYTAFRFVEQIRDVETAIDFYAELIKWDDGLRFGVYEPFIQVPAFDGVCQQTLGLGGPEFLEQWAGFVQGGA